MRAALGLVSLETDAACRFVEPTGHNDAICALNDSEALLAGTAGTIITPSR